MKHVTIFILVALLVSIAFWESSREIYQITEQYEEQN